MKFRERLGYRSDEELLELHKGHTILIDGLMDKLLENKFKEINYGFPWEGKEETKALLEQLLKHRAMINDEIYKRGLEIEDEYAESD